MPITAANRKLYPPPKVWKTIRAAVQARAGDRCEGCGVKNRVTGYWLGERRFYVCGPGEIEAAALDNDKVIEIVCTTAHLDHDPTNNDGFEQTGRVLPVERSNLRFWCQRCHLRYDAKHHAQNARRTREAKKGQGLLFGGMNV